MSGINIWQNLGELGPHSRIKSTWLSMNKVKTLIKYLK